MSLPTNALLCLIVSFPGWGLQAPPQEGSSALQDRVVSHALENGWRFLLLPRDRGPVVSFETYVAVGSADEGPGERGMAHLFEHLAFKGSDRIGTRDWAGERRALTVADARWDELARARSQGDPERIREAAEAFEEARLESASFVVPEEYGLFYENAGGAESLNAFTNADGTRFFVSLPSNQIELWCWLESERFTRPVFREFFSEREAVLEERRTIVDSDPAGFLREQLMLAAFEQHPYRNPVMGSASDIEAATRNGIEAFFAEHYGARRMVTAIVGDIDPEQLIPLLERYFGRVPAGPKMKRVAVSEPGRSAQKRIQVDYPAHPLLACAWLVPALDHPDTAVVRTVVSLLGSGPSSRLERRLVREDASAAWVSMVHGRPGSLYPNLAIFFGSPTPETECADLEAALYDEIGRLAEEGPTAEELEGAKRRAQVAEWRAMQENETLASRLVEYEAKTGDWRGAFASASQLGRVSAADVQRVLAEYFTEENRTVATLRDEP